MSRGPVDVVTFTFAPTEPGAVVTQMDALGVSHRGWINLIPGVAEEDEPDPHVGLGSLFSATGPEVPVCTWAPGRLGRNGVERDSLGIQHTAGTKVVRRLATLGVPLPEGWRWTQDHPRRGLVVRVPTEVGHADELSWLLEAATALSRVRLTGLWEARVRAGR